MKNILPQQYPDANVPLIHNIPQVLREQPRWVVWRYGKRRPNGKREKIPLSPRTLKAARSTDPTSWGTFDETVAAYYHGGFDGIGFVFSGDGILGIDLDNCRDRTTGAIKPWALSIIQELDSYTEVSPSGEGVKIFAAGDVPPIGRKSGNLEIYTSKRFFTVTGNHLAGTPTTVENRTEQIAAFIRAHFPEKANSTTAKQRPTSLDMLRTAPARNTDEQIFALLAKAKNKPKFARLSAGNMTGYKSQSEAELAFCGILAHFTSDPNQIDRIFRQSKLYRHKWDDRRGALTYGQYTIDTAIAGSTRWKLEQIKAAVFSSTSFRTNSQRLVLYQLYDIAQNTSKVRIGAAVVSVQASERDIADAIGVTKPTVHTATDGLHDEGYLDKRSRKGTRATTANTYTLPLQIYPYIDTVVGGGNMYGKVYIPSILSLLLAHDAFRFGALSKSCARFLAVILEHGVVKTLKDLMRLSGLKKQCCKATAERLCEPGVRLVVETDDGWILGPNTLDAVAKSFGTAGKAKQQKKKHMKESVAFTKKVKKWKQEKKDAAAQKAEGEQENERTACVLEPEREGREPASESVVPVDVFIGTVMVVRHGRCVRTSLKRKMASGFGRRKI